MATELATERATSDRDRAIASLTLAFGGDPLLRWLYPGAHAYLRSFPVLIELYAGRAFEDGSAYWTDGFTGAALWLGPGVMPEEAPVVELLTTSVDEGRHEAVFSVFGQMDEHHPKEPVWYLPIIGVEPAHQGKGVGARLLAQGLQACDADGLPAYLESTSPRNIPLYERHGFTVMGEIQAGDGPSIWPMLREAR